MSKLWLLFLLLTLGFSQTVLAQGTYRRLVDFEWEAIEGAKSYDIELQQVKKDGLGKTFSFKTKEPLWNGRLTPGPYLMKLRARDHRGVPGEWSALSEFNVGLDTVPLKSPSPRAKIESTDENEADMKFEWAAVGGAEGYHFELVSEDGKTNINETVKETFYKVSIPVAQTYTWKVEALGGGDLKSDAVAVGQFTMMGAPVKPPELSPPESEFVRQLTWSRPENTSGFDVYLLKLDPAKKKWEKIKVIENYQENTLPFDESLRGGTYQLVVRAKGNLRKASAMIKKNFRVRDGNRSPAAEYTHLVRKSIDRVNGWYGIASYLITQMQFKNSNPENNSSVAYNTLGGTGRMGLGWFGTNTPWGFLGILDMSGFNFNGKTQTFASLEINSVYRRTVGERGELRVQMGPYYKELPETIGDPFTGATQDATIKAAGPHVGAEYWYSLSPKLGVQFNAHLYMSMLKMSTPNGQDLEPKISTQFGIMGSYRFTPTFTGLVGYAMREDHLAYKAVPSATNSVLEGDINETTIVGNYLNFFAEWAF